MQFWVYILRCSDGSYYTGHTDDLEKRMWEHQQGLGADWTRRRRPVELVWCDWANTRDEALEFERRVKKWSRAKQEALLAGDWARVGYLARLLHERPSTRLGTNDPGDLHHSKKDSFVLSPSTPHVGVAQDKLRRRSGVEGRPAGVRGPR